MATELLVTIHDQDLLLECELTRQFAGFPHTYLFVGPRPVDRIPNDVKVIVARDHEPNFEHMPSTYDFSGWWVATQADLIEPERVIALQYDMLVNDPRIVEKVDALLDDDWTRMVAFTAGHRLADNWMLLLPGFREAYDEGMHVLGVDQNEWDFFNEWPCTQGTAWRTDDLGDFMEWVEPLFDVWAGNVWQGHLMERTVKAWCAWSKRPEAYLPGVITHLNKDCHGTCALMGGNSERYVERSATFGK